MNSVLVRRTFDMAALLGCSILATVSAPAAAQELRIAADGRLHNLALLYQGDSVENVAGLCSQRYPKTGNDWNHVIPVFKARNKAQLDELKALQSQLFDALKKSRPGSFDLDTWATIVNARIETAAFVMNMLATLNDDEAQPYCDDARKLYEQMVLDKESMRGARVATAAAVEDLAGR